MQDKHSNDFDLQVRSMLAGAGVKPPRRVWKGVSSRLDAAAAASAPAWGWMKWAGMSLAAAAVAALVFFTGTHDPIPTKIHNQEQALLAQAGDPAGAPAVAEAPAAVPAGETDGVDASSVPTPRRAATPRPAAQPVMSPETSDVPIDTEVSAQAVAEQPAGGQETAAPEKKAAISPVRDQEKQGRTSIADPFAEPAPVRKAFKPRTTLYAQGAVGSNDSDFLPARAMMAPGKSTGFTELGSSSFGVPFTLGLGVRIYLLPRFSLATGLDYSLLTRSFTGCYGDLSGSVSHTLQYLGIPLNLYYDILSSDKIKFYVYGGGEAEYCLSNKYRIFANPDIIRSYPVEGLQFSVGGGFGVEFALGRRLGLYLDPGLNYYFPCNQPRSIRTDKPLLLNFDAGLRFNF